MKRKTRKKDRSRMIGVVMILFGSIALILVFFSLGTFIAYGTPTTVTPAWMSVFLLLGLSLGLGGYRVSSGTWSGSSQILHWTAAISGFFFVTATLRLFLFNTGRVNVNPNGFRLMITVSIVALASWWIRARTQKRRRRASSRGERVEKI